MTKTTIFDTNKFTNRIKTILQQLESETDTKLRSLMIAEATSKVNGIDNVSKNFHDVVKITSEDTTETKIPEFPDEIYAAVMKRIVAVEAPKISSSTGNKIKDAITNLLGAGDALIVKQLGEYINKLLDKKPETISVGKTTYILSNPVGTTSSVVEVTIKDNNKKYLFSWNDDNKTTLNSFNSYIKKLKDYETTNLVSVFYAILKDVKGIVGSSNGSLSDLLSNWTKILINGKTANGLSHMEGFEYFQALSSKLKQNESITNLIANVLDMVVPVLQVHFNAQSPSKKAAKLIKKVEEGIDTVEKFIEWTEEIFDSSQKTIKDITKKYDTLLKKSTDLANYIYKHEVSAESIANLSEYKDFITDFNALETQIGRSRTSFVSILEDYTSYKITDVHNENISENRASIYGTSQNDTITVKGRNAKVYAGEGADRIIASNQYITLIGEQGNDHFLLNEVANNNYVDAGNYNDTISSWGRNNTINGGNGNDSILVVGYSSGDSNDNQSNENEIRGDTGDDTINVTFATYSTVLGEEGNDLIQISGGANNTISSGMGNDTIKIDNADRNFIVYSEGDGNDTIYGFGSTDTLYITEGNFSQSTIDADVIVSVGNGRITLKDAAEKNPNVKKRLTIEEWINETFGKKAIFGTQQDDSINNTVNGSTIDAGDGNDTIRNSGNNVSIDASEGDDYINSSGENITIDGGLDEDYIYNDKGNSVKLNGGLGNDSIFNGGQKIILSDYLSSSVKGGIDVVIDGDIGDDYISNNSDRVTINGDDGNDYIYNDEGDDVKLSGGFGNDSIFNGGRGVNIGSSRDDYGNWHNWVASIKGGTNISIDGGEGDNYIENYYGSNVTINTSNGNDSIYNSGNSVTINAGDGKNYILNYAASALIDGGADNDFILGDDYSTIDSGDGNDTIYNSGGFSASINAGEGDDSILGGDYSTINGGDGNDSISGGNYSTIDGGDGVDEISNSGEKVSINGGADNDLIGNNGYSVTIDSGAGNDEIENWGNNENVTINGGAGNDSIQNYGSYISINGSDDDDVINNGRKHYTNSMNLLVGHSGNNITISGGTGNDFIYNENSYIWNSQGQELQYGKNLIFAYNVGDGNDTIEGFNITSTLSISGSPYSTQVSGDDIIVKVGKGSITLTDVAELKPINIIGVDDSDSNKYMIIDDLMESLITLESRVESADASKHTKAIQITGNDLDNSIVGGMGSDTICGNSGKNTLTGGKGKDIFVHGGGNDLITDYEKGKDKISLDSALISDFIVDNKNLILASDDNTSLTINNAANKQISFLNGSKTTKIVFTSNASLDGSEKGATLTSSATEFSATNYSKIATINAESVSSAVSITGNSKANRIIAGNNGSTLNGGKGKDTLFGGNGTDIFVYNNKSGNKIIQNYSSDDIISLTGAQIADAYVKSNDVILKAGNKKITVKDAANKDIIISEDGYTKFFSAGIIYNQDKTSATLPPKFSSKAEKIFDDTVTEIDASDVRKKLALTSSNTTGTTIYGGRGKDSLTGNSGNDIIYGGKGNDSLYGSTGDDSLIGDKGNDKLFGGTGADSLWGGKGNDTLYGDDGSDTFFYSKGDGKDVIFNFSDDDLLQVSGTFSAYYNNNKNEVSFKVASTPKAITLKDFSASSFNVNGNSYKISGNTLIKK